jgi:signal transduction histidine kinase/CheY-like chemotaxis protein
LALAAGALGMATLAQYLFGWDPGIDELLFRDTTVAFNAIRGRMSPYSALGFASIGLALAALPRPGWRWLVSAAAAFTTLIGALSVLGYALNARELTTDRWLPPVALNSALAFILLGGGTLLASGSLKERVAALTALETKVLAGFIGALLLLLVGGALTYRATAEFSDSAEWVAHTQQARGALSRVYGDIADAEASQRNFLITGQDRQLDHFTRASGGVLDQLEALERLLSDNPAQLRNLAQLDELTHRMFALLRRGVMLYQDAGFPAAKGLVASGQSIRIMESILALTQRMDAAEAALLAEREAALTRSRQRTLVALLLTLLVSSAIFAVLYSGIRREMAARTQAEHALVAAKEAADTANRAKSTFLATMSHEIRTPMNGVLGMLELLSLTRLDAEQRSTLEVVRQSGKSLLRIIDDILDFSKIEAGRLEVRPEAASIGALVEGVRNIYSGNASSKGLLITHRVDPGISPALRVDPLRLRQILSNFVSNAIKFTAAGSVEISAELVGRGGGEERLRFSVKDTGIGISAQDQQHLFQPFSQAAGNTAQRFGGTGLGLAICRRLARMMGGSIEMASELGKGTTMVLTVSLPIADPQSLPKPEAPSSADLPGAASARRTAPSAAQAETEGTLLLVVDDHPTNRSLLVRQANMLGYAAESAENGAAALKLWQSGRFAMVVTDCNMPVMNGYDLARSIRRLEGGNGGARVPIIACTANALGGEAETCLAAGMDDYLVKPVALAQLGDKLERWLPLPADACAPLDGSALAAFSGGNAAAERELLADFRRTNSEDAAMLRHAISERDLSLVTNASHRIKGACRMVGAYALASVCERIEHASRASEWHTVLADVAAFQQECMRLNAHLDALAQR